MSRFPLVRLKWSVRLKNEKSHGELPYIGLEHVESWTGRYSPSYDSDSFADAGSRHFEPGDVLFGKLRPYLAKAAIPDTSGSCTSELLVLKPQSYEDRFLLYWLLSPPFIDDVDRSTYGAQMPRASWDFIGNVESPTPPLPTQRAIADFLDRKTAAIDALIEKKERLLALLAEKRAALIHRAVTKGLDPDLPMTDSGVPWIWEIPAHWEVKRLKQAVGDRPSFGLQMGPFGASLTDISREPTPYALFGQANTIGGDFTSVSRWLSEPQYEELRRYSLRPGDIVMTRKGSLGNCRLVPDDVPVGVIDSDTIRLRVDDTAVLPAFLVLLLHDAYYLHEQIGLQRRGAVLPGLNTSVVGNLKLLLPPKAEQIRILGELVEVLGRLEATTDQLAVQLNRLLEYRQALITAAVTGQLDIPASP